MDDLTWLEMFTGWLRRSARTAGDFLPGLVAAILLLLLGWLIGRLLRRVTRSLLAALLNWSIRTSAARRELERTGMRRLLPELSGILVFWVVFVFFVAAAVEVLGLPMVTNLLTVVATYLPNVLAAVAVVFLGLLGSLLARSAIVAFFTQASMPYADLVGRMTQMSILLVALVTAIDQIGIDSTFLIIMTGLLIGTMLGAAALAFGIGASSAVRNILASHYAQRTFRIGQTVRIGSVEGKLLEITPTALVVDSPEGRVVVPAHRFSEETSVLVEHDH